MPQRLALAAGLAGALLAACADDDGVNAGSGGAGGALTGVGGSAETSSGEGGDDGVTSVTSTSGTRSGGTGGGDIVDEGPYPIVLAHGFFGFEEFAGVDFVTYFYGVREDLAA